MNINSWTGQKQTWPSAAVPEEKRLQLCLPGPSCGQMMTSDRRSLFPIYCALALLTGAVIFEGALIGWLFTKVQVLESEAREQKTLFVQPSPDTVAEEETTSSADIALREGTSYSLCMPFTEACFLCI